MEYPMTEQQGDIHKDLASQYQNLKVPEVKSTLLGKFTINSFWHIYNHKTNPEYGKFVDPSTGDDVFEYHSFEQLRQEIRALSN